MKPSPSLRLPQDPSHPDFFGAISLKRRRRLLPWLLPLVLGTTLHGASFTWTGAGGDNNLSTGLNWQGGSAPNPDVASDDPADVLIFSGATRLAPTNTRTTNATQSARYGGIVFAEGADAFTLGGNRIALRGGTGSIEAIRNESSVLQTLQLDLTFASSSYVIDTGTAGLVFNGTLSTSTSTGNTSGQTSYRRVTKTGAGDLVLNGSNQYVVFTLSAGTLVVGNDLALGTGTASNQNTILDGGTLRGDGTARQLANYVTVNSDSVIGGSSSLTFTGTVNRGGTGTRKLTISNTAQTRFTGNIALGNSSSSARGMELETTADSNVVIAGTISNGTAPAAGSWLVKSGAGTLTLSGTASHTNYTTIRAGTLLLEEGALRASSTVTVETGATLGGHGTVGALSTASALVIASGGTLAPGDGMIGLTGDLTLGGTLSLDLGSGDGLEVTGAITLEQDAALELTLNRAPDLLENFVLITQHGTGAIGGTFATLNGNPLGEDGIFSLDFNADSYLFRLVYGNGGPLEGYHLMAQAIPEPSSLSLAAICALALLWSTGKVRRIKR